MSSSALTRRGFLRSSLAAAGLAVAVHYGYNFESVAKVSASTKILGPSIEELAIPAGAQIPHLLRRAGFGGSPSELNFYSNLGFSRSVDRLVNYQNVSNSQLPDKPNITMSYSSETSSQDFQALEAWWLDRMIRTNRPLEEKMTLFWHNHFATSITKVRSVYLMYKQNQFLRANALGSFKDILMGITADPAMLYWLDLNGSVKGNPNENYAREVMEVFSTGVGPYTQNDVTASARALTGYQYDTTTDTVSFVQSRHDTGAKTFLGHTGNLGPEDIVDILVAHPSTARRISAQLFQYFGFSWPSEVTLQRLSQVYLENGYSIKAVVQAILESPEFLSSQAYLAKVKSPAEFAVNATRSLDASLNLWQSANSFGGDETTMTNMGQLLFAPPSVFGWPQDMGWIDSGTMMERFNFPLRIQTAKDNPSSGLDGTQFFTSSNPSHGVSSLSRMLFPEGLPEEVIQVIGQSTASLSDPNLMAKNVVRFTMSSPFYNLN